MVRFTMHRLMACALFALGGCATTDRTAIRAQENRLVASGFVARPADTPDRQAAVASLPNRIVQHTRAGNSTYLYGDPVVCHCLYVGDHAAYYRYRQMLRADHLAKDGPDGELELKQWNYGLWAS